ncbi:MAG: glycosyltransferase [Caulobacter sp.]|nr:glycosyltransferase [Caulobacter sp.]
MRLLFVHQSFPAQYKHIVAHFVRQPGNEVVILRQKLGRTVEGVREVVYAPISEGSESANRYVRLVEPALRNAEAVLAAARDLARSGFRPDIMIGHNAWGETLFLKEVWPDVPLLSYFEFFYRPTGADLGFDPEFPPGLDSRPHSRLMNTVNLLGLQAADWGQSPTLWQRGCYPEAFRSKISVVHEGIDTDAVAPRPTRRVTLPDGSSLGCEDEVITYVSRNLEPYRGFHVFMRALPLILKRRPRARVLVVGGDGVSYGPGLTDGRSFKQALLEEQKGRIDLDRVHFLGQVPYDHFLAILQVSSVHIYLTYPFVLSWSMLEAMSAGCLVLGSATPPVQELIRDGENGLLVDFFSIQGLADRVCEVLDHPDRMAALRAAARETILRGYDLRRVCLPAHLKLIGDLVAGRRPEIPFGPAAAASPPPAPSAPPSAPPSSGPTAVSVEQAFTLAGQMQRDGNPARAEAILRSVTEQASGNPEGHYQLGLHLYGRGRFPEAAEAMARAVELAPHVAHYHCDLGVTWKHLKDLDRRLVCYRNAVALEPLNVTALVNLASALNEIGEVGVAERICRQAIRLQPDAFIAHVNLGSALLRQNRLEEALAALRRGREIEPGYPEHEKNLGMCLLTMGNYREGLPLYEGRLKSKTDIVTRPYGQPMWTGQKFRGKTVLLHSEQGMGDTLNFIRYAPLVKRRGGRVVVECQAPLIPVIRRMDGVDEVVPENRPPDHFDYYRSLVSLPLVFGHTLETIPRDIPYLSAPPERLEHWRRRLPPGEGFRVGLAWAGSPGHGNDRHRSTCLESLRPLLDVPGVRFCSLQKGDPAKQLAASDMAGRIEDIAADFADFGDTAAALECLDLVISVDTSVIHMAGALGRPVWVLTAFTPDWRWLLDRDDTPWYSTMRLLRQERPGDWEPLIARAAGDLTRLAAAPAVPA